MPIDRLWVAIRVAVWPIIVNIAKPCAPLHSPPSNATSKPDCSSWRGFTWFQTCPMKARWVDWVSCVSTGTQRWQSIALVLGSYFSINASTTISTARHDRGRGLRCSGSTRLGDHALAGRLCDFGQEEEALPQPPQCQRPRRAPGAPLDAVQRPGVVGGESAQPIRLWRRLRWLLVGGRSLNAVCSWQLSRRNQAKSG